MEKDRKRLDKIFSSGCQRMQEEVSALLGKTLEFAEPQTSILRKEDFFSDLTGKYVFAKIRVEGDINSLAGMFVPIEAAIRIGGTLIMLPDAELGNLVSAQEYSEELKDSYGEIANIISGSLTSIFEEQFPKKVRLIRTDQEIILPAKVDVESDEPFPNGQYFLAVSSLTLNEKSLGALHFLLPAESFGLLEKTDNENIQQTPVTTDSSVKTGSSIVQEGEVTSPEPETVSDLERNRQPKGLNRKKLDKIFHLGFQRVQEEVSALLGKKLDVEPPRFTIISKEDCFADLPGKTVFANVGIQGALEGKGALLVSLEAAIRIGGTLIMLPDTELESCISDQEYSDDLEDSYGEIANIICGSLTSTFEEQLSEGIRLVRAEQEVFLPMKVDIASEQPCPDGMYYQISAAISMDNIQMGDTHLLLPADVFGLLEKQPQKTGQTPDKSAAVQTGFVDNAKGVLSDAAPIEAQSPASAKPVDRAARETAEKRKKKIDKLIHAVHKQIEADVGGLLGGEFKLTDNRISLCDKESFLEGTESQQVMARLDVRGDNRGEAYLFISKKDAIFLGGTLVMLPELELEQVVTAGDFSEDFKDAYGEVANIIAGCYTAIFEEQYDKSIGFAKTELETIIPVKIDPESNEIFPQQGYYLSSAGISFDKRKMGRIQLLVPVDIFTLELLLQIDIPEPLVEKGVPGASVSGRTEANGLQQAQVNVPAEVAFLPDIIIVADDNVEAETIRAQLKSQGYYPEIAQFKDPVYKYLSENVKCVFLVMKQVNEQGFGVAIKINSVAPSIPLVLAGPAWTRTLVLKAVKYGATDILITPSSSDDVMEKTKVYMTRIAA
jgi:chemotaxis protein CheY-P-specific phosphatase CheC